MINAGKYNKRISIITLKEVEDDDGYKKGLEEIIVIDTFANIKTTKGFTLIASGSDFEKAYTNFTIRYPKVEITRDMLVKYNKKNYTIVYLNNINEENIELEIQAKKVVK